MSNFKLWADEEMNTEFGAAYASGRLKALSFERTGTTLEWVMYFGAKDAAIKLQNAAQPGNGDIVLSVADALPPREKATLYQTGFILQPETPNGCVYRVTGGGTSGSGSLSWPAVAGQKVKDGTAEYTCLGRKHTAAAVRLALSQSSLDAAVDGAALTLGKTLNGGAALAIWVRVTNAVPEYYDTAAYPMLSLDLNPCAESAK